MRVAALSLLAAALSAQATPATTPDDREVVRAVLAQVIRPQVDTLLARPDGWRGSPMVVYLEQTIPTCPNTSGPWGECVDEGALVSGVSRGWWSHDLSIAFAERNGQSVVAPALTSTNVLSARYDATEGRRPPDQFPRAAGWLSVSLPAYSGPGLAIIYVDFECGAMCCSQWFIVLERAAEGWRVKEKYQTVIC